MMEGERKLATIRRIGAIDPIPGADAIVKVTVDGWELVSQKANGFQVGDLVVYFEIDSFLPVCPAFEFLRDRCFRSTKNLGDGFRLKTIKLRGQVSQGLILPLSTFFAFDGETSNWAPELFVNGDYAQTIIPEEGTDLTMALGVQKYEKPIPANLAGKVRGNFPFFIPKTDQERIQNCFGAIKNWIFNGEAVTTPIIDPIEIEVLNMKEGDVHECDGVTYFKSGDFWFEKRFLPNSEEVIALRQKFEATLKLDGSSVTLYHKDQFLGVCSRNLDLTRDTDNLFWKTAMRSGMLEFLFLNGKNLAVQGELMGPGVQGNRECFDENVIYVFDIYDIDARRYLTSHERFAFMREARQSVYVNREVIKNAPVVTPSDFVFNENLTVKDLVDFADVTPSIGHDVAEGIVFKSLVSGSKSFKVIAPRFLLKEKD